MPKPQIATQIAQVRLAVSGQTQKRVTPGTSVKPSSAKKLSGIMVERGTLSQTALDTTLSVQKEEIPPKKLGEVLVETAAAPVREVADALRIQQGASVITAKVKDTVRVEADRLDRLVDMVGELVIAESMVAQGVRTCNGRMAHLASELNQLDKITRELQEIGMSLRMVPIRATFQKMARLVRDLSRKSGKAVEFRMTGEDTELDKSVVDQMHRLGRLFEIPDAETDPSKALIVVLEESGRQAGVMVDELLGQQQTVIKNLGEGIQKQPCISGGAIMSDGCVGLIVDAEGLMKLSQENMRMENAFA